MPSTVTLLADRLLTPCDALSPGWVTVSGDRITAVGSGSPPVGGRFLNLGECLIIPGYVDIHVHGGGSAQVNGSDVKSVATAVTRVARFHAMHGTTALLPTTVSATRPTLIATIRGVGHSMSRPPGDGARILGAHLEGPWLSPLRAGAHNREHLRSPTRDELDALLAAAPGVVRMVTLAPELPGALDVIAALSSAGVVAAVGHSDADLVVSQRAFEAGARHVTHIFNAMRSLHHRDPGLVGAALDDARVSVELIADGVHIDPLVLALVLRAATGRVVAVTDAVAVPGAAPGCSHVGGLDVEVREGRVVLADAPEVLAGSLLTMDRALANLVAAGVSLTDAVGSASATPARVIGEDRVGRLIAGASADLAVLAADLTCAATVVGGRTVHDRHGLLTDALPL